MALVEGGNGADTLDGTNGNDTVKGFGGNDTLNGFDGHDILDGGAGNDVINSGDGEDLLLGGIGLDTLVGGLGNNRLDGGAGVDTMTGGAGNDTYVVDNAGDLIVELSGEGNDTVESSVSYTLGANLENLTLTGAAGVIATGNALDNILTGNSGANKLFGLDGNDTIDGGFGGDQMTGGTGDDVYIVDNTADRVTENAGDGVDEVRAYVTYTLAANVENLLLEQGSVIHGTGNALDNLITGNDRDNTLNGMGGTDTLLGGLGNDTYVVDDLLDIILDADGVDTIRASLSYDLSSALNVENLVLTGTTAINGTGDGGDNVLTGNTAVNTLAGGAGNDTLNGGAGADVMIGGSDDDTYYVDNTGDIVSEDAVGGIDTVFSSVAFDLTAAGETENLTLTGTAALSGTGNALGNIITGNAGANTLSGGAGDDTLNGGNGNDILNGGADNDTLDGGAGTDTLRGGTGDDVYIVNAATGKVIVELAGEGIDEVQATVTHTLAAEVDNLDLLGTANLNGTGNALVNVITGTSGNNTLNGLAGADTLTGNGGIDVFIVDDAGDVVNGTGVILSSVTRDLNVNTLGVDNLTLTGTAAIDGTGNANANTLTGNSAVNTLDGQDGDDVFVIDATDIVDGGAGSDTVVVGFTASTGYANWTGIENITLTGTALLNATGDGGDNTLTGNNAKNTLDGGLGNDTYVVTAGDVIIDAGGTDTVRSAASYTATADIENIVLTGTLNVNAFGNAGINTIQGNAGNNTLESRSGDDTLAGGAGNDVYVIDGAAVTIIENAGEGIDTVRTAFTHVLQNEVENLVLTGTAAADGTGNALENSLTGNSGANTLDGGAGADVMAGGAGDDVYFVDNDGDRTSDTGGFDVVFATDASHTLGQGLENLTLLGTMDTNGTGNNLRNVITGNDGGNSLNGMQGADTMIGGLGNDTYIVDSTADVVIENIAEGSDTVFSSVTYTLSQDVDNLNLTGSLALTGTGNALANIINGNGGANVLYGRGGDDSISGGAGNDILYGELGNDTLTGGAGRDIMFGGEGADNFHFDSTAFETPVDIVRDYSLAQGDVIDVTDLLTGYDPLTDNASDFVRHVVKSGASFVQVDLDGTGTGSGWVDIALLTGLHPVAGQTAVLFLVPT